MTIHGQPIPSRALGRGSHASGWAMPTWAWVCGSFWLVLLGAWVPAVLVSGPTAFDRSITTYGLAALGASAVLSSIGWGTVLAALRGWRWLGPSLIAGTGVLLLWYLVAMFAVNDPGSDGLAAVGLMFISVPTLLLVAVLLAVGYGIGTVYHRLSHHWH